MPDTSKPATIPASIGCELEPELGDWPSLQPRDYGLDWLEARELVCGIRVFPNKRLRSPRAGD